MPVSGDAAGSTVYGTAYDFYGPGNLEGSFAAAADGGTVIALNACHGDSYSTFPLGDAVYVASHSHYCGNIGAFTQTDPWTMYYATAFSKAATRLGRLGWEDRISARRIQND